MNKLFLLTSAYLLMIAFAYGQNVQIEKKLDSLLFSKFKSTEPGCAILAAKNGELIYKKAFGSADLELNVPLAPEMIFNLASITKQFTAVAILQLVERGKISLQDSLQKFIPDFPSKGQTITIENLLTHTSGIRDYMQIDYTNQNMERRDFNPKQLIDGFKNYPLEFVPGTKYAYSNSGYYLLGYIIERVSGKSYQNYVQSNILEPLGLNHTCFDTANVIIPNRVNGYRKENNILKHADYWSPTIAYAAGGLLSNTDDLYKWFKAVLSYAVLKKETIEKAFTPFRLRDGSLISYGYGWYVMSLSNTKSIEHAGHMAGFTTDERYYPEQDVFIAALFNNEDAPRDEIVRNIAEIVLGKTLQVAVSKPNGETLSSYTGTYKLVTDPNRTIDIIEHGGHLFAKISGQNTFELLFQTPEKFQLKNVNDMVGEFILEKGKVTKLMVDQNGQFEWKKVK